MLHFQTKPSPGAKPGAPTIPPSTISAKSMEKEAVFVFASSEALSDSNSSAGSTPRTAQFPLSEEEKSEISTYGSQHGSSLEEVRVGEEKPEYPSGFKLGFIVLAICLSILLMALE